MTCLALMGASVRSWASWPEPQAASTARRTFTEAAGAVVSPVKISGVILLAALTRAKLFAMRLTTGGVYTGLRYEQG
jgi:hypothetical protein